MKKIIQGSRAIAQTINSCRPAVVSAYPITPQTHIVEDLAKLKADGLASFEYVTTESEFAAISVVEGASAMGVRTYTATSAQGLLLMTEVLYNVAGMRLPVVMTCANRAVSGPINIWNDQQDAVTMRDSGWLMWFGENVQEVCDLHILAYKVAEKLLLPAMVNLDGFVLTHVVEPVEIESSSKIKKFLPRYQPEATLDVKNPKTFGAFVTPEHYFEMRQQLHLDMMTAKSLMKQEMKNFKTIFGRRLEVVEYYGDKNAEIVLVAMGSVIGTMKEAVDGLRNKGQSVGLIKVVSLRPFPAEEVVRSLKRAKTVAVLDKSISLGAEGILATEIRRVVKDKKIISFVAGLGGRDITISTIERIYHQAKTTDKAVELINK